MRRKPELRSTSVGAMLGTVVLTTVLRGASELGLTRMDLPFLLGTAVTGDRRRAKALGYVIHFGFGELFALAYHAAFTATGRSGIARGAAYGAVHGMFSATALVNVLLPAIHPRMGDTVTGADTSPPIEPPGFLILNYGRATPVANLVAHVAYGAIIGHFAQRHQA